LSFGRSAAVDAERTRAQAHPCTLAQAELYLSPGDQHYFADPSLPAYDLTPRRC